MLLLNFSWPLNCFYCFFTLFLLHEKPLWKRNNLYTPVFISKSRTLHRLLFFFLSFFLNSGQTCGLSLSYVNVNLQWPRSRLYGLHCFHLRGCSKTLLKVATRKNEFKMKYKKWKNAFISVNLTLLLYFLLMFKYEHSSYCRGTEQKTSSIYINQHLHSEQDTTRDHIYGSLVCDSLSFASQKTEPTLCLVVK